MADSSSTSSSRRRFFIKLTVFLLLLAGLDFGIGNLLRQYYFKQKSGLNYRTTYAVEQSRDDIIILGSSRAQSHYVPSILASQLEGSCYNAGRNGQSLLYASAVHNAILSRQAPRVIILDLILTDFFPHHGHYDRLSALLPYYKGTEAVRPIVRLRSPFESIKLYSSIYPFNSLVLQIIKYNFVEDKEDRGYVAQRGKIKLPLHSSSDRPWLRQELDDRMITTLEEIVASCIENDIDLYPVISPVFDGSVFGRDAIGDIEAILAGTPYSLWDFSDHQEFIRNQELFSDRGHLNKAGAAIFTEMVGAKIKTEREPVDTSGTVGLSDH